VRGKLFIDCTGDGWVGYFAGAAYRFGRESRDEFGETAAPPKEDRITMSGCIMGDLALSYRAENTGHPVDYTPPAWAVRLPPPEAFHRTPRGLGGLWWLEHPGDFDDREDPERARDELIRISFAYWGWVKNAGREGQGAELRDDLRASRGRAPRDAPPDRRHHSQAAGLRGGHDVSGPHLVRRLEPRRA
jgi:hypothetical protein